jgi:hypothetical protein
MPSLIFTKNLSRKIYLMSLFPDQALTKDDLYKLA